MRLTKETLASFTNLSQMEALMQEAHTLPKSSFLFVTYNRCPHDDFTLNPLAWAVQSLAAGRHEALGQILIVDDGSTDHTAACVAWLQSRCPIPITYHRNSEHRELSHCRAEGLKLAHYPLVFLGDDDCVYSEYFVPGALFTYQFLSAQYEHIAVINLNAYEKCSYPRVAAPKATIGFTQYEQARFSQNFNAFPQEYLSAPQWLHAPSQLLQPLETGIFRGVNLCNARLVIDAGNYTDLSMWKYGYSEHLELSRKLQDRGYRMFHQPDPRIYAIHLNYGGRSKEEACADALDMEIAGTGHSLRTLVEWSEVKRLQSGTRSSTKDFHFTEIGTLFSFYLKLSSDLGVSFAVREYRHFVEEGLVLSSTPTEKITDRGQREAIWKEAIRAGISASERQTGKTYNHLTELIFSETLGTH